MPKLSRFAAHRQEALCSFLLSSACPSFCVAGPFGGVARALAFGLRAAALGFALLAAFGFLLAAALVSGRSFSLGFFLAFAANLAALVLPVLAADGAVGVFGP